MYLIKTKSFCAFKTAKLCLHYYLLLTVVEETLMEEDQVSQGKGGSFLSISTSLNVSFIDILRYFVDSIFQSKIPPLPWQTNYIPLQCPTGTWIMNQQSFA